MLCLGLNEGYTQFGLSAFTMHEVWIPPAVPVPVPGIIEGPAFMGWFGGLTVTHKVGKKTNFDGNPAVQQGHDCGYLIPHIQTPNILLPMHIAFSKHKVMFPVSTVLIEGKPLGTYVLLILGGLICANPVSLPTGVLICLKCTVFAHLSGIDIFLGVLFIGIDMALDAIWNKFFKGRVNKMADGLMKAAGRQVGQMFTSMAANYITRKAVGKLVDHVAKTWITSPLFQGLVTLPLRATDIPPEAIPSIGVGRGNVTKVTFFPTTDQTAGVGN